MAFCCASIRKGPNSMRKLLPYFLFILGISNANCAQENLVIWHGLDGEIAKIFNELIDDFSKENPLIKVTAITKGNYNQTLDAFLKNPEEPDVVQIFEMGTVVMQDAKKFIPIDKVFSWDEKTAPTFIPAISSFYKGHAKHLQCVPFLASSVIMFYNKTLLDSIGATPPETFEDFEKMARKFKNQGTLLTLASGWLSGHHMDQIGAIHNIPIATKGNGIDGHNAQLVDNPFFHTHWTFLQTWYGEGLFSLKAGPEAEKAFAESEVVFLSQGANRLPILEKIVNGRFEIGVAHFPYWKSIGSAGKTIAGGSAFWVAKKHYSTQKKTALIKLLTFLADVNTQRKWQEKTGCIPVVAVPVNNQLPKSARLVQEAFSRSAPLDYNRGILLPNFPKIRDLIVAEMTSVIKGDKRASDAMLTIIDKGNVLLKEKA